MNTIVPFATSYLRKAGFSAMAVTKSKYRSRIDAERKIRMTVSKIPLKFHGLCKNIQAHVSLYTLKPLYFYTLNKIYTFLPPYHVVHLCKHSVQIFGGKLFFFTLLNKIVKLRFQAKSIYKFIYVDNQRLLLFSGESICFQIIFFFS